MTSDSRQTLTAVYRVREPAATIAARAKQIALEQSIEMSDAIVTDAFVRDSIIGRVEGVEARGPDGTVFLSQMLSAGEVYRPDASPGWTLHARDGGAFELYVDGVPAGLLGLEGQPVLGRQIDEIAPVAQASAGAGG